MRRIVRFLARLYPKSWRKRYGAEFDALLEDATPSPRDAFDVSWGAFKMQMTTWSFSRITLACTVAGVLVAAAVYFAMPVHYLSQSFIVVTPADGATHQMINLQRTILSQGSLTSIIQKHNLYPRERARMPLDDVIERMRSNIILHPNPPVPWDRDTVTFRIEFDYSDPRVAQQVNSELVSRFMEGNLRNAELHGPHSNFEVFDPPSLPIKPAGPNRMRLGVSGLFAGLLAGLTLAIVMRSRRGATV
jgi:uncharacterized protein involved in exopolysaccharide biosynthesis